MIDYQFQHVLWKYNYNEPLYFLGLTAIAHDRALYEHAQCIHAYMAKAKDRAISEWLSSKSKEEQTRYLSHHNQHKTVDI